MNNPNIERAAETHYMIRPAIVNALKNQILSLEGKSLFPTCETYLDVWKYRMSDKFFDMATLISAAASVETSLRDYYILKKGYKNLGELRSDSRHKHNIFQRIQTWHGSTGAIALFQSIKVDLNAVDEFHGVQELMIHRHLYAHNLGVIDEQYIQDLRKLKFKDLQIPVRNPLEDQYWFEPLDRLNYFIESVRKFFSKLD